MKRLAEEMVQEGKARDEKGELFHPVMAEPMVMAFFGAPDALYEVLAERPIVALNLIMTNKALEAFWNQFEGVWIAWIDMLVEKEMSSYAKEIYPFFIVQNHRLASQRRKDNTPLPLAEMPELVDFKHGKERGFYLSYLNHVLDNPGDVGEYYVIYHDSVTQLYMDLLDQVDEVYKVYQQELYTNRLRRDYLKITIGTSLFATQYTDCIVLIGAISFQLFDEDYQLSALRRDMPKIMDHLGSLADERGTSDVLDKAQSLAHRLSLLIGDETLVLDKLKILKLDKSTAAPYRSLLYDREQGLFNTPEKQRALFVKLINDIPELDELANARKERLINKYGEEMPLSCARCGQETMHVDPLSKIAFCDTHCYKK